MELEQLTNVVEGIEQLLDLVYVCADCKQIWMPEELSFADEQPRCPECDGICEPLEDIDGG